MYEKKLLIINSSKDISINQKDILYINIGNGNINIPNSKKILLKKYRRTYHKIYKKKLLEELNKKILKTESKISFFIELELFNLRNDKNSNIDLIINILIIKDIIKKYKFKDISLITDNILTHEIFSKNYPKIKHLNKLNKFSDNKFSFLKITKFYIKTFFIITLLKFFKKNKSIKSNNHEGCISLKPIFYKKDKETFFKDKNIIKFNFLLTDETHLNFSLIDAIKVMKCEDKNLIHVESFISLKELIRSLVSSYYYLFLAKDIDSSFTVDGVNLSKFYKDSITSTLINRLKLNIYNEGFIKALKKFKIKKFNLYLFEYSFGFFLINLIKKRINKIEIIGHQHGIFSNELMWFDLLIKNKNKNNYIPDKIVSFNRYSFKDYKQKINCQKTKFNFKDKTNSSISLEYLELKKKKQHNKILVLPGTHDADFIYKNVKNKIKNNYSNDIFYLKFHPKKKISAVNSRNLKIISSIKNKKFTNVVISPTSTLVYDFIKLKKNFMIYTVDYKQNLISSNLSNKVKFYFF